MTGHPKLTIITPSLNQGSFIEQTIRSVLAQKYPNLEYFIFDGGSTDQTLSILKKYRHDVSWQSAPDHGQADAINKGLRVATGELIAFINADDYYLPGAFATIVRTFQNYPQVDLVTGDCQIIDLHNREIHRPIRVYKQVLRHTLSPVSLAVANGIPQPSTFWRDRVTQKIGLFNPDLKYTMDYEYWLRSMHAGLRFKIIPQTLAAFRIHPASKGGSQYLKQFAEELMVQQRLYSSWPVNLLHRLHIQLITTIYRHIK